MRSYQSTDNEQVRVWEDPERECEHKWGDPEKHGARGDRGTSGTGENKHPALGKDGGQPGSGGGGQFCTREREVCDHEWETERVYTEKSAGRSSGEAFQKAGPENVQRLKDARWREQAFCKPCGAWKGALGLEPTIDLYVAHMVSIFREVRRVLRDDGVCLVNMGDGYNAGTSAKRRPSKTADHGHWTNEEITQRSNSPDLKPKDLIGQPFRLALALQADGWWWRAMLPWCKPSSAMPESTRDRPAVSTEYWIMLAKSGRYYWDGDGIRKGYSEATIKRISQATFDTQHGGQKAGVANPSNDSRKAVENLRAKIKTPSGWDTGAGAHDTIHRDGRAKHKEDRETPVKSGRSYRTGDMLLESIDEEIEAQKAQLAHLESVRNDGGLLLDEDGDPVAVLQNPQPFKGAKYLGDWERKEWRLIKEADEEDEESKDQWKKVDVWYIAHPNCSDHAHYHRPDRWKKLGYADGREIEAQAGDADPKAAKCPCVEVKVDHFAAFGEKLIAPLLKAGCPRQVCAKCGAPWVREIKRVAPPRDYGKDKDQGLKTAADQNGIHGGHEGIQGGPAHNKWYAANPPQDLGFRPTCECGGETEVGVVLDCFGGTGTTGAVAKLEGLRYIGIDVSRDYNVMASARIHETGKPKDVVAAERAGQGTMEI